MSVASYRPLLRLMLVLACLGSSMGQAAERSNMFQKLFQKRGAAESITKLQDVHGPWLILAATFSGDDARSAATTYAQQLKVGLKVPAFLMERSSETPDKLAVSERIRTDDETGTLIPKQVAVKYLNNSPTYSVAVLVGEFHSRDDPQIDSLLAKVNSFQPKSKLPGGQMSNMAFLTRNPLLPDDFFQAPRVDKFIEDLNRQDWIKHSLLDCPGRFTVRVASFRGPEVVTVSAKAKSDGKDPSSTLDRAASKAHKMTASLRSRGVEAYEFHDRYGSYVMIGSFDQLGYELPGGQFQYEPAIIDVLREYCGYREVTAKDPATGAVSRTMTLNSEARLPFDVEGKPTAVPRPATSHIYGGSLFK